MTSIFPAWLNAIKMASDPSLNTDTFTGDLTITVGSDSLTINPAGKTLGEIRDLINSDENNPGVTASIINVGSGNQRLLLSAEEEGYESRLQLGGSLATSLNLSTTNQVPETNFFGQTEYVDITDLADLDASFTVDGFSITSSSNQASSVIDGITFELKEVGESRLTLDRDDEKIKDSVQEFVDAYNALHSTLDSLSKNELAGDSSVRSIQSQIRNVFNTAPTGLDGSFQALVSVGIDSDARTGTLSLDASSLENALSIDFQSVADLFAHDEQGFSSRLADIADNMLDDANIVDAREEGLRSRIREVEDDIFSWEARLELKERALRAQFASLDALIGSLQSTSAFLAQNLVQQQ